MHYVLGAYAPLTSEGNIIVDGVLASCHGFVNDHDLVNVAMIPLRKFSTVVEWIFGDGIEFTELAKKCGVHLLPTTYFGHY